MRSNAEFDRFISGELKRAADCIEAPSRCKAEIDELEAEAGFKMRTRTDLYSRVVES